MKCNLRAGGVLFTFKIAFDEDLAQYSPGKQLDLENIRIFNEEDKEKVMDSCAVPSNATINRMLPDRLGIRAAAYTRAGLRGLPSAGVVASAAAGRDMRRGDTMSQVLELDPQQLSDSFSERPFAVRHGLVDHPLLTLDSIAELAETLQPGQVEQHLAANVSELLPGGVAPQADMTPAEIARGIETNGCWMVLKHIESDPKYGALLDEALSEVVPHVAGREGGESRREAFMFLSAPNSVTPSHFDPEHNLLLQVRGTKEVTVGEFPASVDVERELERYYAGGHRNVDWLPANEHVFNMDPGDGVYIPVHAPHMVRNGPTASISFSITFYTRDVDRDVDVYSMNARMRKLRLSPAPPGSHPGSDKLKAGLWRGVRKGGRLMRDLRPSSN